MRMLIWTLICIITGVLGMFSVGLSGFVSKIEDDQVCLSCKYDNSCVGRKKIGKNSNVLTEFMLFSYLILQGKCNQIHIVPTRRKIIYFVWNAIFVSVLFWSKEYSITCIAFSVSSAMLFALSIVDWNTQYIPVEYTIVIFLCGLIHLFADFSNWLQYLIGLIAVSGFLCIVNWIATPIMKKRYNEVDQIGSVIGDGDIKLMAATGLLLGWKLNFIALGIGCIMGSIIHLVLMKIKGSGRQFAFGPYLSLGVYITMICGEQLVGWYLGMLGMEIPYY